SGSGERKKGIAAGAPGGQRGPIQCLLLPFESHTGNWLWSVFLRNVRRGLAFGWERRYKKNGFVLSWNDCEFLGSGSAHRLALRTEVPLDTSIDRPTRDEGRLRR